jgi:hypothetical protein
MSITEAQAQRALRHVDIPWDREVEDPREDAWVVHDHLGLLGGLAAAFSIGCRSLRRAEDFFADLGLGSRRALGLGRGTPCDTTLYRLLAEQSPAGLEETLFAQVKDLIARKVVKNDRLHVGVISFDGNGPGPALTVRGCRAPSSRPTTAMAPRYRRSERSAPLSRLRRSAPASGRG